MISPVLLCGGSGTRLWPLSRKSFPKQFTEIMGSESLFQSSVRRVSGEGYQSPVIITGSDYRFVVSKQLSDIGIEERTVLIEPDGRNTAPAVLAAALHLAEKDPNQLILIAPSDHVIPDNAAFQSAVNKGVVEAQKGNLVTFGIQPDRPETGYGYLELPKPSNGEAQPLTRFVEKPDLQTAQSMLASGTYLWNAGIFLFTADTIIKAFEHHAANLIEPVSASVSDMEPDLTFFRLGEKAWADVESISIDYAVMEKADNLSVVPFTGKWSDLGDWTAVWRDSEKDAADNALYGESTAIDCENSLIRSEHSDVEVVGIGLKDMMVVATKDAVLVANKSKGQDIKQAVSALKAKDAPQAEVFPRDNRPWGWFETLGTGERFQVKRIVVNPNAALSLQSHVHRAEHWIVVSGTAKVTIGDEVKLISENQSVYIPLGEKHRLENPGKVPMVLIEVQTGSYLGEDDIVRYEDIYSRSKTD